MNDFSGRVPLGKTGIQVSRLALALTYRPGRIAVKEALDAGVNCFFGYGFDTQFTSAMREQVKANRGDLVLATGAYNLYWGHPNLRRSLEKRLRQLGTDYIDIFLFLGVNKPSQCPDSVLEELARFRQEGKVRAIGISGHDRKFAGELARDGKVDVLMSRYNAAHRGAEDDVFPHLASHNVGLLSYTATRWTELVRRPRKWPNDEPYPTAPQCYRFVLSNPNVSMCQTAPSNLTQLRENLAVLRQGPLADDEMRLLKRAGDMIHAKKKWFM
ncbi:MAG: aldo/keto reductase [candidate division Zixibacteria bacterium]|nr:aldo/keto reductase [candidate division Zixibacteria bacterium]